MAAVRAAWAGDSRALAELLGMLGAVSADAHGQERVAAVVDQRLVDAVGGLWPRGWQPGDVAGVIGHRLGPRHRRLAVDAVASQARSYRCLPAAYPAWLSQLSDIGAETWWGPKSAHLSQWASREGISWSETLAVAIELLVLLGRLPAITRLCPPPSEWDKAPVALGHRPGVDSRVLTRVRSLLAKAESTDFPAEAEALTAKAQELMTRHALDHAMLPGKEDRGEEPTGRRLRTDNPYAGAKACLLDEVASANRCRSVWSSDLGFCTVLGFPSDLEIVEILFTSLLVQGTTAMLAAGVAPDARRRRSRSFRQSFLMSYAGRIGERLREADAAGVESAERRHGEDLLPVLRSRAAAVDDAFDSTFQHLRQHRVSANDLAGRIAGRAAGDMASLAVGEELQQPA